MAAVPPRVKALGAHRLVFTLVALVPLAIWAVLLQGWRNQIFLVTSWFGVAGGLPAEFLEPAHRLHEVAFALITWPLVVGLLAQFRSPQQNIAGMWVAMVMPVSVALAMALTTFWEPAMILLFVGVPTLVALLLHPAGLDLVRTISIDRVNRVTLGLLVVAAVPLGAFTATQVGLQTGAIQADHDHDGGGHADDVHAQHVERGHFAFTAAIVVAIILTGLIAVLQQPGWWLAAWLTGAMSSVYGLASLAAPDASSNPGTLWAVLMVLWGIAFVLAAEYTQDSDAPSLLRGRTRHGGRPT